MQPTNVIINSIPKSGTYLLTQLVSALGVYPQAGHLHFNDQHYTTGVDEKGALNVVKTPAPEHLDAIPAGHSVPAHLTWSQALDDKLHAKNTAMFFMYRDPRDIVISYAKFAMYSDVYRFETEGHRQYYDFLCTLENDQRRVEHVLSHRLFLFQFDENAPWLTSKACVPISFEALYTDVLALNDGKIGSEIKRIMDRLGVNALPCTPQEMFTRVHGKSKTAMGGSKKIGVYKEFFDDALNNAAQVPAFRAVLKTYGYHA